MELLELRINNILLLDGYTFIDQLNNIDYLNAQAIASENLQLKLTLLNKATNIVEKFHSYFHFEQSYFHLHLAILYQQDNLTKKANEQLELAIFQDHLNFQAKQLLYNISVMKQYERPFSSFDQYLSFATGEVAKNSNLLSFWAMESNSIEQLELLIEKIRFHHLNYHSESAKLYLNRALVFHHLLQPELASNDLKKALSLDSSIMQKDYYLSITNQMKIKVVLGLGSNLNDRERYLKQAIEILQVMNIIEQITCSSIINNKAALKEDSPKEWDMDYLNMAIMGYTKLSPELLLIKVKEVEQIIGRTPGPVWSPREIDIDILAYANEVIDLEYLQIPHLALHERPWAIIPFAEIYPDWKHPKTNKSMEELKNEQ